MTILLACLHKATPLLLRVTVGSNQNGLYKSAIVPTVLTVLKGQNIIPSNDHCVPNLNNCQKGDLTDESVTN